MANLDEITGSPLRLKGRGVDRRFFLAALAAQLGPRAPARPETRGHPVMPACGVTGYRPALEYTFGTTGNVRSLADLRAHFTHDAPWGRINGELQSFQPFNARNYAFETDCLALTGLADGSGVYNAWGHITSGALISRATCFAPCVVEIVAKLPAGRAVWPSLYLADVHSGKNDSSEIDIMESQYNAPIGRRDDRSFVYQFDHGPGVGADESSKMDRWGRWQPYGPMPGGDMSARWAAYSALWLPDRITKYVDNKAGVTRMFKWTGPAEPNILIYNSIGSDKVDWPGPVSAGTFAGDNAKFRIKSIRVFKPKG
ncbi:MAG: family 16 glycosylhydrolase [Alphaproteobacteria bacterium]|nr:family 16 glycosylhydrolase [Alphaproteobacteria bacterium]